MIAVDTSTLVAYFSGETGVDVESLADAARAGDIALPPAVVTEILSDPAASAVIENSIQQFLQLTTMEGYWTRAGHMRRLLHSLGLKAKVGDALIAQSCIDHDVALITRDREFRHFAKHCGLKLA